MIIAQTDLLFSKILISSSVSVSGLVTGRKNRFPYDLMFLHVTISLKERHDLQTQKQRVRSWLVTRVNFPLS